VFLLRTAHVVVRGFLNRHADVLRRVTRGAWWEKNERVVVSRVRVRARWAA
jgi:hypothetical protein